ncbi:MAG: amidohydrolase family protein [Acidobacteria bacterium]|nr:amidohydrolase family protein [Acidobacteriota bacterium]
MKRAGVGVFVTIMLCSTWGLAQQADIAAKLGYPQTVLYNGKIVTMDDASFGPQVGTIAQAMAVRDGKILATGTTAEVRALAGPQTKQIDLKGRTVLPSFIMTHEHPTDWALVDPKAMKRAVPNDLMTMRWLSGTPGEQIGQWETALKDLAANAKPGQWVWLSFTWGPDFENANELVQKFPQLVTRQKLDQLVPNNPAHVRNAWPIGDQIIVNSKGLEEARKVHPDAGERIGRPLAPDVIYKGKIPALAELLKAELEIWASNGVTTFGSSPYAYGNFQALAHLDRKGEMPARFAWGYTGSDMSFETLSYVAGLLGNGTDHLWNVGAWGGAGGSCTTINAKPEVKEKESCSFAPGSRGRETLERIIKSGGRIATMHSYADKDIDYLMDGIEIASREAGFTVDQIRAKRHAFDHASGAPRPDQLPRIKTLGMMVSMINTVLWEDRTGYDMTFRVRDYGIEYANWTVPRKSVNDAGIMNTFEIDRALPEKTFFFILKGMTRFNDKDQRVYGPAERTDRITQLKALTRWGGYYVLRENLLGTLEPGKFADFIILDRDFLTIPEEQIPQTQVLMTVVGGRTVHLGSALAREIGMTPVGSTTWPE